MQSHVKISTILLASLLPATAIAQTGEFAATIPGAVVHAGYALQDEWQRVRNTTTASQPIVAGEISKPRHRALHNQEQPMKK